MPSLGSTFLRSLFLSLQRQLLVFINDRHRCERRQVWSSFLKTLQCLSPPTSHSKGHRYQQDGLSIKLLRVCLEIGFSQQFGILTDLVQMLMAARWIRAFILLQCYYSGINLYSTGPSTAAVCQFGNYTIPRPVTRTA